jgi:hypothetical protein
MTDYFEADPAHPGTALRHAREKKRILDEEAKERVKRQRKPTRKDPVTGFDLQEDISSPKMDEAGTTKEVLATP